VQVRGQVDELGIEILLDRHGLNEIEELVLEFGDLVGLDDGIDIHQPVIEGASDTGDLAAHLVLVLDVNDRGRAGMDLLI